MSNFELFRFVDVHSPDNLSRDNNPFITSFDDLITAGGTSTLVDDIKEALDPENETPIEDINTLLDTFIGGTTYIANETAVNTVTSDTLIAMKLIQELTPFDKEDAKTILQDTISAGILTDITSTTIRDLRIRVWNNLIVEIIRPTGILLKDALINALRVYRLIEIIILDESGESEIKKTLRGIPVLPAGIFKLPYKQETPETPEPSDDPTIEEINIELQAKIDKLIAVYEEILGQYEELIRVDSATEITFVPAYDTEGNLTNPEEIPAPSDFYKFTDTRKDLLSEAVDEVLTDLGLDNEIGRKYDATLEKITVEKKDTFEKIFSTGKKYQKSLYTDGLLLPLDGFGGSPEGVVPIDPGGGGIYPAPQPWQLCKIKPVGIGDYRKVEQSWEKYIPGEVAHIENVMQTELRDRETRHLRRKEETLTVETVREEEVIRDLQTTERFALVNETSKVIAKELETDLAANINGKYGMVNFSVDTGISYGYSSQVSQFNSTEYAKEVVEKASKRVTEMIREEKVIKILEEFEEKNKHTFDNIEGTGHVVGVYRWLNLEYKCKLMNYGRRLTFEFSIPEPAAFHIYAKRFTASDSILLENPIHPKDGVNIPGLGLVYLNSADSLDYTNFLSWASAYDAKVEPYPANKSVSKGYFKNSDSWASVADNDFSIPEGYYAKDGSITCDKQSFWVSVRVDTQGFWFNGAPYFYAFSFVPTVKIEGTIAVSTVGKARYFANITLNCEPTKETIQKWQIETYNAIMDAYEKKKRAYDDAMQQILVQRELQLSGTNPALYRQTEMKELKKGCIQLLNGGYYNLITGYNNFFDQFNAMKYKDDIGYPTPPANTLDYPEFDNCDAIAEGHVLSFFEKVFDWDIMSYKFFPYFWGQKKRWKMLYNLQDNDALFTNFLQAGHAKVLIPVKPGFEAAAIQFLETGQLWNGGAIAGADPDNLSALNMIDDFYDPQANSGEPIVEHEWATNVPTNLVVLQCETGCVSGGPGLPENTGN